MDVHVTRIESRLLTKNIYLDTEVFIAANFHYDSAAFRQLISLVKENEAKVFVTDITIDEVKANINEGLKNAFSWIKNSRKDHQILRNISDERFKWIFNKITDKDAIYAAVEKKLLDFLNEASIKIIPIEDIKPSVVFEKYFSLKPPFSEGRKKSEFPDAFAVEAINKWCADNKETMYIVSNDNDFKKTCENYDNLFSLSGLKELLNLISLTKTNVSEFANSALHYHFDSIKDALKQEFEELGFIIEDENGEVEDVKVTSISIPQTYLISVDERSALFDAEVEVDFDADVSYDDINMTYKDSETGNLVVLDSVERTISRSETVSCEFRLSYSLDYTPEDSDLDEVRIDERDISILIDEDFPYQ